MRYLQITTAEATAYSSNGIRAYTLKPDAKLITLKLSYNQKYCMESSDKIPVISQTDTRPYSQIEASTICFTTGGQPAIYLDMYLHTIYPSML